VRPPLAALAVERAAAVADGVRANATAGDVVARWLSRSLHADGDRVRCRVPGGVVEGAFRGLAADGRLRLEVDGREELLVSAEVEWTAFGDTPPGPTTEGGQ
jgi:biotin-(acetyl-CoA carboxylase) ligase